LGIDRIADDIGRRLVRVTTATKESPKKKSEPAESDKATDKKDNNKDDKKAGKTRSRASVA
jgi:hypothetical protein